MGSKTAGSRANDFMQEQGYVMEPSLIYQDNMSAILLENNGKLSSSKRTRHIKIKYYHMKEKKDDGEISFEHCPTEQMWADINTKPKQGAAFREFRGHVLITMMTIIRILFRLWFRSRCYL